MPRDMRRMDMRGDYGSRSGRMLGGRRDRRMGEHYGYNEDMARRGGRTSRDYGSRRDYADMYYGERRSGRGRDGANYYPIEAMGRFEGYYGMPQDYESGRNMRDRNADYDYYPMYDGHNVEYLSEEDLEHWTKKLMEEVDDKDKAFFSKETLKKKAEEMGVKFDKFIFEELLVTTLMMYTDYCKTLGKANMALYISLAKDWLEDDDVAVKGAEKLATYYDYIVEGM